MDFKITQIEATDIQDAWFQAISKILDVGFKYEIQQGSFVGQTRLEFDFVIIYIKYPYQEPWDMMLPKIPAHLGIPDPVEPGYIEQYMPYLMTDHIESGEDYTYGNRIWPQIPHMVELLKNTPNTNQAILQVAKPNDYQLEDPPCLRHINLRIKCDKLIFYPYFRSWDLYTGMPANLAGLAVLQKYIADLIGVESGPMCCSSNGCHLYGYVEKYAKLRVGRSG